MYKSPHTVVITRYTQGVIEVLAAKMCYIAACVYIACTGLQQKTSLYEKKYIHKEFRFATVTSDIGLITTIKSEFTCMDPNREY